MTTQTDGAVADPIDPIAGREQLCRRLKTLRLQRDLTQQQVADALGCSQSKVLRLEAGHYNVSADDLDRLLVLYGLDEETRHGLVALALGTSRNPWASYRDVLTPRQVTALRQESAATAIRCYQPSLIPDLLQTPAYASHLLDLHTPSAVPHSSRQRMLDVLRTRQQRLDDDGAPTVEFVIAEDALLRGVHALDPFIVIEQLDALAEAGAHPRLTIQILPLTAGLPGVIAPFTLLSLPDIGDELLWSGYHPLSVVPVDRADHVHHHREVYATITRRAADPAQSLSIIASVADALQRLSGRTGAAARPHVQGQ